MERPVNSSDFSSDDPSRKSPEPERKTHKLSDNQVANTEMSPEETQLRVEIEELTSDSEFVSSLEAVVQSNGKLVGAIRDWTEEQSDSKREQDKYYVTCIQTTLTDDFKTLLKGAQELSGSNRDDFIDVACYCLYEATVTRDEELTRMFSVDADEDELFSNPGIEDIKDIVDNDTNGSKDDDILENISYYYENLLNQDIKNVECLIREVHRDQDIKYIKEKLRYITDLLERKVEDYPDDDTPLENS